MIFICTYAKYRYGSWEDHWQQTTQDLSCKIQKLNLLVMRRPNQQPGQAAATHFRLRVMSNSGSLGLQLLSSEDGMWCMTRSSTQWVPALFYWGSQSVLIPSVQISLVRGQTL